MATNWLLKSRAQERVSADLLVEICQYCRQDEVWGREQTRARISQGHTYKWPLAQQQAACVLCKYRKNWKYNWKREHGLADRTVDFSNSEKLPWLLPWSVPICQILIFTHKHPVTCSSETSWIVSGSIANSSTWVRIVTDVWNTYTSFSYRSKLFYCITRSEWSSSQAARESTIREKVETVRSSEF